MPVPWGELPEVPAVPGAGRGRLLRAPATETAAAADRGIPQRGHAPQLPPDQETTRNPAFIACPTEPAKGLTRLLGAGRASTNSSAPNTPPPGPSEADHHHGIPAARSTLRRTRLIRAKASPSNRTRGR